MTAELTAKEKNVDDERLLLLKDQVGTLLFIYCFILVVKQNLYFSRF